MVQRETNRLTRRLCRATVKDDVRVDGAGEWGNSEG